MGIGVAQGQEARTHRDVRRRAAKPRLTRTPVDRHPRERFVEHTLQIVIQAALDVAAHIVSDERLGEPRANRELFDLLERHAWIGAPLAASLRNMVGFRNVLVHGYDHVNLAIVRDVLTNHLVDLERFVEIVRVERQSGRRGPTASPRTRRAPARQRSKPQKPVVIT